MNTTKKLKTVYLLFISLFLMNTGELIAQTYVSPLTSKTKINIIECTKGERVALGSDNNALRWSGTNGNEQLWQILSKGTYYYIQNFKQANVLEIGWNGNVQGGNLDPSKKEQLFRIEKLTLAQAKAAIPPSIYNKYAPIVECTQKKGLPSPVEFVRIRESTKNEYVSVGSNGNILRWSPIRDKTQVFILMTEGTDLRCSGGEEGEVLPMNSFRMVECTKGEMVAAGSNNNVLRWFPTKYYEQEWQLKPEKKGSSAYYIESMKTKFTNVRKNLAVNASSGNISIETHRTGDRNQLFRFEILTDAEAKRLIPYNIYDKYADLKRATHELGQKDAVQYVRILESSRDERVAVGSDGNILRWEKKDEKSQVFILVETHILDNEAAAYNSFSDIDFQKSGSSWKWVGAKAAGGSGIKRTIRSPYDGEPIMTYSLDNMSVCDGCSTPLYDPTSMEYKKILLEPCLAHDANYRAPWQAAGFDFGRQVSDDLFLMDMKRQVHNTFKNSPFELSYGIILSEVWYKFVSTLGAKDFTNPVKNPVIHEKGGIVSVTNTTQASVSATVSYVSQSNKSIKINKACNGLNFLDATIITNYNGFTKLKDGKPISEIGKSGVEGIMKSNIYVTTIPVTVNATQIIVQIKVNGNVTFTRTYRTPPTENLIVRESNGRYTVELIPSSRGNESSINVEGKFQLSTNSSYTVNIVREKKGVKLVNSDGQSVYYARVGQSNKYVSEARSHQSIEYVSPNQIRYFDKNKKTESYFNRIK